MDRIYDVNITSRMEDELKRLDVEPIFCENAMKILEKRYLMKNNEGKVIETPKDMLARVAANIAYADIFYGAKYEEVYDFAKAIYIMMSNLELLPNSPALRGAGRETQQLSACFVLPIEDSRKSIFGTLMDAVDIQAFGGGTGFSFSRLRPRGSMVESTGGEASGPISFMQIYDMAVGKVIAQGGVRQGANMGILNYDHPDIIKFIDVKLDGKTLSNFNISVGLTEDFMEMAENGIEYDLINPHTKLATGKANARDVLDRIAHNAWSTGDPGLIFLDRINRANPTPHIGMIESTNPCVAGDTLVAVADGRGAVSIKQLADECKDVPVYCCDNTGKIAIRMMRNSRLTGVNKRIVKVNLDDGNYVRVTENHNFILSDGTIKQARDLTKDDSLSIMQKMVSGIHGFIDDSQSKRHKGYVWLRTTNRKTRIQEHRIVVNELLGRKVKSDEVIHHKNHNGLDNRPENLEVMNAREHYLMHAKNMIGDNNPMHRFPEKNWMNDPVKQQKSREKHHIGVKRSPETCKRIREKAIVRSSNPEYRFGTKYGFDDYRSLKRESEVVNHKVLSVEFDGYEDVYNGTVDEFHNFYIGGFYNEENGKTVQSWIVTKNCGEIPLLPFEACNLASINLARMVQEKDGECTIDYDKLAYTVKDGVHLLDNVIDMNKYPLDKIEEMTKGNRKIGLGVMGWADLLAMMSIPYNSDQALELAEKVMEFINTNAKAASVELAKSRGIFPNFKNSIYDTGKEEDMVRNASWTTIAPTGTLSTLAGCNGGIEPFFMIVYRRGSIYNAEGKPTIELLMENEIFRQTAVERGFYSEELAMKIAETGSLQHIDEVPDGIRKIFVTSHDIGYEWHVKMQSAFQKHVTNAVSKTINFPKDATPEDIKKSFELAYKLGNIKGITVYRDGCKEHQVLSTMEARPAAGEDAKSIVTRLKASRPRKVSGTTERMETPVGTLFMTVNCVDGNLYEVFLNIGKAGADVTADAEGYGRLLSMIFKAGIPPGMVVDQLRGIGGSGSIGFGKQRVRSLPDAIARVLEMYLEECSSERNESASNINHKSKMSGDMCPECGNMLVFEEGCSKCRSCGYSRC